MAPTQGTDGGGAVAPGRIVVGLDDDAGSWAALEWALGRAARRGAAVEAVRVTGGEGDATTSGCASVGDRGIVEVESAALRHVAVRAARVAGAATAPRATLSWRPGRAGDVLVATAAGADALVVGCPGGSGRTLRAVLDRSPCPVTVVRTAPEDGTRGRVVVVVTDGAAPPGELRAALAATLAATPAATAGAGLAGSGPGDRVLVVGAFAPRPERSCWPGGGWPSPTADEQGAAVRDAVAVAVGELRRDRPGGDPGGDPGDGPGVVPEVLAWPQDPAHAVLTVARHLGADEVVLPAGGPWSVARLVRAAPCPVTVVPAPGPPPREVLTVGGARPRRPPAAVTSPGSAGRSPPARRSR